MKKIKKNSQVSLIAPCKINLNLHVGKRRSDGFHDIDSTFLALEFGDKLKIGLQQRETTNCEDDNLVMQAIRSYQDKSAWNAPLGVRLMKKTPMGAGLGGGSSDAASALLAMEALNTALNEKALGKEALLEMGLALGSDVPFFLKCYIEESNCAQVTGRGEHIEMLPAMTGFCVLLAMPEFTSSTVEAYKVLDAYRAARVGVGGFQTRPYDPHRNDFLPALNQNGQYDEVLAALKDAGAVSVGLSGSGSCCFGIIPDVNYYQEKKHLTPLTKKLNFSILTRPMIS
ncbi:MAG: hypothetical protein LBM77_11530 [Spirochaetaceae bacterium]|nr:hypothetical protein [Spirochaetaceae bacterium]